MKPSIKKKEHSVLISILVILASILSGCGTKQDDDFVKPVSDHPVSNVSYNEQEVPLPDLVNNDNVVIAGFEQNTDQELELFLYDKDEEQFRKYVMFENGQWNEATCSWLDSIPKEIYSNYTRIYYEAGGYYALYGEENGTFHLICSTDGINAQEIDMDGWQTADQGGHYPVVSRITILPNNTVAVILSNGICQVYKDGKLRDSFNGGEAYVLTGNGKYVARYNDGNTGIFFYNTETEEIEKEVRLSKPYQNIPQIFMIDESSALVVGDLGIVEVDRESGDNVVIVTGDQPMLSNAAYFPTWLEKRDETIYVLFTDRNQTRGRLIRYQQVQGDDKPSLVSTDGNQLTIYGLYDNELIRTAVSEFSIDHPDIDIVYEVSESAEGAMTENDLVRTLNARIAAGNGPDIFVLDGLPMDSYADRGILEDLSGILSETDVIPNIQTAYESNARIYAVPTRVGLPIIIGTQEVMSKISSLNGLADYAGQAEPPYFVEGSVSYETVIESFLPYYINSVVNGNHINQNKLRMFLEDMKKISDSVNAVEITDFDSSHSPRMLAYGQVSLAVCTMKGIIDDEASEMITFAKLKGDYAVYQNSFEPYGLLGVYKASGQKELAMEFVKAALSYEVQETEYRHGGFPVSRSALEKWRDTDSERSSATGDPVTGVKINIEWPDAASRNRLFDEILSLETPIICDQMVQERMKASAVSYLKGEVTIETAVEEIANEVDLYLQE